MASRFTFTIRDWLWLCVAIALLFGWWSYAKQHKSATFELQKRIVEMHVEHLKEVSSHDRNTNAMWADYRTLEAEKDTLEREVKWRKAFMDEESKRQNRKEEIEQ